MVLGLLRCEHAALDELRDEGVIARQLLDRAVAHQVAARVADVPDRDDPGVLVDERDRCDGAHPGRLRILDRALPDPPVRLLDQRDERVGSPYVPGPFLQRRGCELRRDLARAGSAHAVGDGEERWLADEGVLVPQAPPPGVGHGGCAPEPHRSSRSSV